MGNGGWILTTIRDLSHLERALYLAQALYYVGVAYCFGAAAIGGLRIYRKLHPRRP